MIRSKLERLKYLIDCLTPYAVYSERIDTLLSEMYVVYAEALALDTGVESEVA